MMEAQEREKAQELLKEERLKALLLKDQFMNLQDAAKEDQRRIKQLEQEVNSNAKQHADMVAQHELEKRQMATDLRHARSDAAEKASIIKDLHEKLQSKDDLLQRAEAAWENERRAQQAAIREVTSCLQQALAQARHMELAMRKAKKTGTEALQDRLASMIQELDAAKGKLAKVTKERDYAEENSSWLTGKLAQKTRQNELERQFLPLIRVARGPLGPVNQKLSKTMSAPEGKLLQTLPGVSDGRLQMLQ